MSFLSKARVIHGDKYDYTLVDYKNSHIKVEIVCPIHGIFRQTPTNHLQGKGCSECRYESLSLKYRDSSYNFISKAKMIHGDKYDYTLVDYKNLYTKIKIVCPIHGIVEQKPSNHLRQVGCPKCSKTRICSTEEFIRRANLRHNYKYDYSYTKYVNNKSKVIINCKEHGLFSQAANNHLFGNGCPKCNKKGVSKLEKEIVYFLKSFYNGEIIENDKKILEGKEVDIYIPEFNIAIEFDGLYWHNQQNLEKRGENPRKYHLEKTLLSNKKGVRLIHIFEDEWVLKRKHVEQRLKHFLGFYTTKIGARKVKIRNLPPKQRREFLERNHIQGKDGAKFSYGAYYNDTLVGIMSFCKPRVSMGMKGDAIKVNMYELSRFAVESGWQIYGLASKMFKHFIREELVDSIYTYSDLRWNKFHGTGTVYEKICMEYVSSSSPSYFYIKDGKIEYRFKYRKNVLIDKLSKFDKDKTEYENCLADGLDRVFDCGCDKFVWRRENK